MITSCCSRFRLLQLVLLHFENLMFEHLLHLYMFYNKILRKDDKNKTLIEILFDVFSSLLLLSLKFSFSIWFFLIKNARIGHATEEITLLLRLWRARMLKDSRVWDTSSRKSITSLYPAVFSKIKSNYNNEKKNQIINSLLND